MTLPLIIISGPSGVGKTTTTNHLLKKIPLLSRVITATTRPPRAGEQHGKDYFFLSPSAFEELTKAGCFLETNRFSQHSYAIPRSLWSFLLRNKPRIVLPDIHGAIQLKKEFPAATAIWLEAPLEILERRLLARSTENSFEQKSRLQRAAEEMQEARSVGIYDHFISMHDYAAAEKQIAHIIYAAIDVEPASSSSSSGNDGNLPISRKTV